MKNNEICDNCGAENPIYYLNCKNCNAFLRSRVVNLDLFSTIGQILETPIKTTKNIILSEHKNYVILLMILTGIKFFINALFLLNAFDINRTIQDNLFFNGFIAIGTLIIFFLVVSLLVTYLNQHFGLHNRFKDNLAIYTYSFLPQVIALAFMVPVEYALYGPYWFVFNPSPFLVKPMASYVVLIIEGIMLAWSLVLLITSTYTQTRSRIYSAVIGIIIFILYNALSFYVPFIH